MKNLQKATGELQEYAPAYVAAGQVLILAQIKQGVEQNCQKSQKDKGHKKQRNVAKKLRKRQGR